MDKAPKVKLHGLLAASMLVSLTVPSLVAAQEYPDQPIRFISAFSAGSGADLIARFMSDQVSKHCDAVIIVENKPGAIGNIATEYVARAAPDGYTVLLSAGSTIASNMHLFRNPPVDVNEELQVVATINQQAFMFVVDANGPIETLADLTEHLAERNGDAAYASSTSTGTVMAELYLQEAGFEVSRINYTAAIDSLSDLVNGHLDFGVLDPVFSVAQAREGNLRVLGHGAGERLNAVPDIPTMAEQGYPEIDVLSWFGAFVPHGTPDEAIGYLNGCINEALETEEASEFFKNFGSDSFISTPADGQALLRAQTDAWESYVEIADIELN